MITLEHAAIWTKDLERLKEYYCDFFGGTANTKYSNIAKGFSSYFLSFDGGARLEIMSMVGIEDNANDRSKEQYLGIIHLAFGVSSQEEVDAKAIELSNAGYPILSGPRKTGDGYYEFETLDPDNNRLEVTVKL